MDDVERSISDRIFDGESAKIELEGLLYDAGLKWKGTGWDEYDCSLEIHGVAPEYRLPVEIQKLICEAGFIKVYVNHTDKWETHYTLEGEFSESKGWRVSYPHKRGESERGIWVEDVISTWPKKWFDTGYVLVKKALGK